MPECTIFRVEDEVIVAADLTRKLTRRDYDAGKFEPVSVFFAPFIHRRTQALPQSSNSEFVRS